MEKTPEINLTLRPQILSTIGI
ncbi:hypothetical protein MXB_3907 [Myxobolus squamalis]|nr:hypothetical protein MXB_3907 [Myxobolus squamalis]